MNLASQAILKRRKARQDFTAFDALIATPGDLLTGFSLPANGKLFVSCDTAFDDIAALLEVNGSDWSVDNGNPGSADNVLPITFGGKDATVKTAGTAPGVVSLYVANGFGTPVLIGQG